MYNSDSQPGQFCPKGIFGNIWRQFWFASQPGVKDSPGVWWVGAGFHGGNLSLWKLKLQLPVSQNLTVLASQVVLVVKNPPARSGNIRDACSIPGLGRSPGGGQSTLLQYSCLESSMDKGSWQATVHRVAKSYTWLKQLSTQHEGKVIKEILRLKWSLTIGLSPVWPCIYKKRDTRNTNAQRKGQETAAICRPRGEASSETNTPNTLFLDFQPPEW